MICWGLALHLWPHPFVHRPFPNPPHRFAPAAPPVPECRDPAPPCRAGPRVPPLGSVAGLAGSAQVLLSSLPLPALLPFLPRPVSGSVLPWAGWVFGWSLLNPTGCFLWDWIQTVLAGDLNLGDKSGILAPRALFWSLCFALCHGCTPPGKPTTAIYWARGLGIDSDRRFALETEFWLKQLSRPRTIFVGYLGLCWGTKAGQTSHGSIRLPKINQPPPDAEYH